MPITKKFKKDLEKAKDEMSRMTEDIFWDLVKEAQEENKKRGKKNNDI